MRHLTTPISRFWMRATDAILSAGINRKSAAVMLAAGQPPARAEPEMPCQRR